jgi:hypothetical protein
MADHPAFNVRAVEQRRDKLVIDVFNHYQGHLIVGERLDQLTAALHRTLPGGIARDTVFESIRYLAGQQLGSAEGLRLAWRLAGNLDRLREGQAVLPWANQARDEWVPLQFLRSLPSRNNYDVRGITYTLRVLAGTSCPMRVTVFWKKQIVRMAASKVGFSQPWGKYPFHRSSELVGLRMMGLVVAARSQSQPAVYNFDCPDSMVQWNREHVLYQRFRAKGHPCPQNWSHPCHRCVVGYDQCPAGTHYRTFERGTCDACGHADQMFDPELNSVHCINCTIRERLRKT